MLIDTMHSRSDTSSSSSNCSSKILNTQVTSMMDAPAELVSPKDRHKGRRVKSSSLGEEEEEDCYSFAIANDQENGQYTSIPTGLGVAIIMPSLSELRARSVKEPVNFVFSYQWPSGNASANKVTWTLCLVQRRIFFNVPPGLSVERSKEAFVTLLEVAEEAFECTQIVVSFGKDRPEKQSLIRMFMFLGFVLLPPGHSFVPLDADENAQFMAYDMS